MNEQDKKNIKQHNGREVNRANQDFQHVIGYSKSNDEYQLWTKCQGYWDNYIEVAEWTTVKWSKERKGIYLKFQQTKWSHQILWEIIKIS